MLVDIETKSFPSIAGTKTKLKFTEEFLPDLKCPFIEENTGKTSIPMQPARVGAKFSSSMSPPGKCIDVQDAG